MTTKQTVLKAAHVIHQSGLGFTFSRCLAKAWQAIKKTDLFATELREWLIGCAKRAYNSLSLSAYYKLFDKINSVWAKLASIPA